MFLSVFLFLFTVLTDACVALRDPEVGENDDVGSVKHRFQTSLTLSSFSREGGTCESALNLVLTFFSPTDINNRGFKEKINDLRQQSSDEIKG